MSSAENGARTAARAVPSREARPQQQVDRALGVLRTLRAEAWTRAAIQRCERDWERLGPRYARRLASLDRARLPAADVMALAARRLLPLSRHVRRPLPDGHLPAVARAFNRMAAPDRYALTRLDVLGRLAGARAEHLASALERLVLACRRAAHRAPRAPPDPPNAGEEGRSPCPGTSRGLQT